MIALRPASLFWQNTTCSCAEVEIVSKIMDGSDRGTIEEKAPARAREGARRKVAKTLIFLPKIAYPSRAGCAKARSVAAGGAVWVWASLARTHLRREIRCRFAASWRSR